MIRKYRVVHLVEHNLLLTLKYELQFSIRSLYCRGTFNWMSTNCVPRPDGPPCTSSFQIVFGKTVTVTPARFFLVTFIPVIVTSYGVLRGRKD